eukprot:SAG11_NODE_12006_length_726_cov_72.834131_1_plen_79_part_10
MEPTPTRVWSGLRQWGGTISCGCPAKHTETGEHDLEEVGCANILYPIPPGNQLCMTREQVEQFILPKNLKKTPKQFYQE